MTLNGVTAVILRYFAEFGRLGGLIVSKKEISANVLNLLARVTAPH